ncbi:hypothetical protein LTR10_020869 [Elasticomyces elasticus]|uniref:Zn(2)-C6 fungal-type domain-containing protein n=1 Tax=Exophiala sideris TaxID=1016849 RepID=A0ABR0J8C6_9EURO|nr:hypothetical protein LTR10_020869 [Elasticomyces elasticus]KAK5025548.1 hypothetical protein LTR13_010387 [Exophiala sideris]KAK5029821.1 hypothetical protein LTS07_005545 [Exophiala sideris]KAK5058418.1 hypothetical protein LTR69_006823 [Exophiala sideris]KAK5178609.1 hypothetical protein LTR44_008980 [Eurotiomycetes sp. CCFEE 6388]
MTSSYANVSSSKARQRVSIACVPCRRKRTRCDGGQPICGVCFSKGSSCEYAERENKRKPPSQRLVDALRARIKILKTQLKDYQGQSLDNDISSLQASEEDSWSDSSDHEAVQDNDSAHRDPVKDITELVGRLNVGEDGELRYYGSPSNFHLLHGFMKNKTSQPVEEVRYRASQACYQLGYDADAPVELQQHLLDIFWKWQNSWQYIVHQTAFLTEFNAGIRGRYCTPLLLSAVLAIAARYSDRSEVRSDPLDSNTAGDRFAQQAKMMLHYEIEASTTSTVQAATLIALREFAVNKEASAWVHMGIATRIAYNLGLNLDCYHWVQRSQISTTEEEVRKVAWWGCYLVDKLTNIGLGRPSTIQEHDITIPKPSLLPEVEFEHWQHDLKNETFNEPNFSRMISNNHYVCELFGIISTPLDRLYAPKSNMSRQQKGALVASTDVKLTEFQSNLPSFLRLPNSARNAALPHICQLHLQYQVAVILLHRPFVETRNSKHKSGSSPDLSIQKHMEICRASAIAISNILRTYRLHYSLRRIVISSVHCTFTASTIHLYDTTSSDPAIRNAASRHFQVCISSLREMETCWAWSSRALRAIQLLAKEWVTRVEEGHETRPEIAAISKMLDRVVGSHLRPNTNDQPSQGAVISQQFGTIRTPPVGFPDPDILAHSWPLDPEIPVDASEIPSLEDESFWNSALSLSQLDQYFDPYHSGLLG